LVIAAVAWQSHKKIVIARSEATRQSSVASEARQSSVASEARQSQPYLTRLLRPFRARNDRRGIFFAPGNPHSTGHTYCFSGVSLMFLNENKNIDIEQD